MKDNVIEKIKILRGIINEPRMQYEWLQRKRDWSKLCNCIDTIEDTETAISSYLELEEFDAFNGGYLYIYMAFYKHCSLNKMQFVIFTMVYLILRII